jgi:hypothetical protein
MCDAHPTSLPSCSGGCAVDQVQFLEGAQVTMSLGPLSRGCVSHVKLYPSTRCRIAKGDIYNSPTSSISNSVRIGDVGVVH